MGLRSKIKKYVRQGARKLGFSEKTSKRIGEGGKALFVANRVLTSPVGSLVHHERTREGGVLNTEIFPEYPENPEPPPPTPIPDEEEMRRKSRRARRMGGRSSTILSKNSLG